MITLASSDAYTIGWIAPLPIEYAAAKAMLDECHEEPLDFEQHPADMNSYTWGHMNKHNIVIASLPAGIYGTTSASATASSLLASLPQIRIGLLVGIGGGVVQPDFDIRLGDVVVSKPDSSSGGVIQYDLGKAKFDQWERKGALDKPPLVLLNALTSLQAQHEITSSKIPDHLETMWTVNPKMKKGYIHQGAENDRLFHSTYNHGGDHTCDECDSCQEIKRNKRESLDPEIHYGRIASGNTLIKDATTRDRIAVIAGKDCICVEMEAAGLMHHFPCLIIRGICDYADSHKNDAWQRYASATAAAYAKELLEYVPGKQLQKTPRALDIMTSS